MNEALRLLKRALKPFGYDLKRAGDSLLLPLSSKSIPSPETLTTVFKSFDNEKGSEAPYDLAHLVIYLRTCLRVDRNIDTTQRLTGLSLHDTVHLCLKSLIQSINHAVKSNPHKEISVCILDDHSDNNYLEGLNKLFETCAVLVNFQTTTSRGQGNSLHEQFSLGRMQNALCYFCEDDYLHTETAIHDMWSFYEKIYWEIQGPLVIHPQETNSLYTGHYPSYILLGDTCHWRTINHATHVLFIHGKTVDRYWDYFENTKYVGVKAKRGMGSESKTSNLLFKEMPGFCPIPAVAAHIQFQETLPPFYKIAL
jgi:hypothetical protein